MIMQQPHTFAENTLRQSFIKLITTANVPELCVRRVHLGRFLPALVTHGLLIYSTDMH